MAEGPPSAASPTLPRRLVIVRHGQTAWNLSGRAQGHLQVDLDDTGRAQARAVAPVLAARYAPVRLWCSDLRRAMSTAAAVASASGLTPRSDAAFREYGLGPNREGTTVKEWRERFPEEYALFKADRWHEIPGRETHDDVRDRFVPGLQRVAEELAPGQCALVVSHGAAIKTGVAEFLGWPESVHDGLGGLGNCHWVELEESASGGINGPGTVRWRLVAYNVAADERVSEDENNAG